MKIVRAILDVIGNVFWFILVGFSLGLLWILLGAVWCVSIIGIPFGIQCFKLAKMSFFPYGKTVELDPMKHPIANVIWALLFGWELALAYVVIAIFFFITIIGIPKGLISLKTAKLAILPFGATVEHKHK